MNKEDDEKENCDEVLSSCRRAPEEAIKDDKSLQENCNEVLSLCRRAPEEAIKDDMSPSKKTKTAEN